MTSGADFTAEGTETIRDFSSDPAVDFETDENLAMPSSKQMETLQISSQDMAGDDKRTAIGLKELKLKFQ